MATMRRVPNTDCVAEWTITPSPSQDAIAAFSPPEWLPTGVV
jgi:hypothetical protein